MRFDNRVAIVTGAASGFGEVIAHNLAREGASALVSDLDEAGAFGVDGGRSTSW